MKEKLIGVLKKKRLLQKNKPRYFYLNTLRVLAGVLFWISALLPFYNNSIANANIFNLKVAIVYFLVLVGIPVAIGFYALQEDIRNLILIVKSSALVQILFMVLMLLTYFSSMASYPNLVYKLGFGFYLMAFTNLVIFFASYFPNTVVKILTKIFKFDKKDVIEAEIINEKTIKN